MEATMNTFRLMHDSGVSGPVGYGEADTLKAAATEAADWSDGQTGHPWDTLTLEFEGNVYRLQRSSHGAGRRSIQVFDDSDSLALDFNR